MVFRALREEDKKSIYDMYKFNNTLGTEYCFVMLYQWMKKYDIEIAYEEGFLALRATVEGKKIYYPPLTKNNEELLKAISLLEKEGAKNFFEITEASKFAFCGHGYKIIEYRNSAEYIYSASKLINLSGKKLHSKRNHISKFQSLYKYEFLSYIEEFSKEVENLLNKWEKEKSAIKEENDKFKKEARAEKNIIMDVLKNLEAYNCFCDVLTVDKKIIGFSIGERLPTGVGAVYFEKADISYEGSYTVLNKLFSEKHFSDLKYVNRQEDMGDEGLRRAKLSYQPKKIYMKYMAEKVETPKTFQKDIIKLYKEAFPEDSKKSVDFFFENVFKPDMVKEIRENDLKCALHIVLKRLSYFNKLVDLPFITGLATFKKYRGQGYAKKLLEETLDCMRLNVIPFVALYPAIENFYEKLGFEKVFSAQRGLRNFEKIKTSNKKLINDIYNKVALSNDVYLKRDIKDTELRIKEEKGARLLIADGKPVGYEIFDDGVSEICLTDFYEDELPQGMVRILNLYSAFKLLKIKGEFRFKLTDCLIEENNNIFSISESGLSLSEEYDFELSERELAGLFFGKNTVNAPEAFKSQFPKNAFLIDKY